MNEAPDNNDGTTAPEPAAAATEAAALGLSLTPEEIAQLSEAIDPSILALLAQC